MMIIRNKNYKKKNINTKEIKNLTIIITTLKMIIIIII